MQTFFCFFVISTQTQTKLGRQQALLHGLIGIGIVAIITKIHRWDESAMFFDGGSLGERPHIHFPAPPFTLAGGEGEGPPRFLSRAHARY